MTERAVTLEGEKELRQQLRKLGPQARRHAQRVALSVGLEIEEYAKLLAPTGATGALSTVIRTVQSNDGLNVDVGVFQGDLESGNYAPAVETGRKPGRMPPFGENSALRLWALRKVGDEDAAFPIARSIAETGTEANPFLGPAFDKHSPSYVPALRRALNQLPN